MADDAVVAPPDDSVRREGLGALAVLSDKLVLHVLKQLDRGKELLWLNLVSRVLYAFATHDKLWREMCFRRHGGDFVFKRCWRYTAFLPARLELGDDEYPTQLSAVPGFHSELFNRRWYIGHCDVSQFDIDFSHIEKLAGLSVADFEERYLSVGRPVVLTDATKHWTALQWTPEKLIELYGNCRFRLNWGVYRAELGRVKRVYITMRDFWHYVRQQHDVEPGYIFDGAFWRKDRVPGMVDEFDRTPYFREDLFSVLGENRPDFRWFLCGPAGSGSPFHTDPHATSAWNGLLHGRKRWALYPPTMVPPGVTVSSDDGYQALKPIRWYVEVYPHLKAHERPIELIQKPGEIIFVPAGWWHMVLNVTDTIAVTQNWIDRFNFHVAWTDIQAGDMALRQAFHDRLIYVRPELFEAYEEQRKKWASEIDNEK